MEILAKRAMFCDPIFKAERRSYPVPTPGALDYCLRAVYWKPQMRYVIKKIYVMNEPKYGCDLLSFRQMKFPYGDKAETSNVRSESYLRDVHYYVEFDIELTGINAGENNVVKKHVSILENRLQKGKVFKNPYLGTKECMCEIYLADKIEESSCKGIVPLGYMLHHVEHDDENGTHKSIWYCPVMIDGVIDATVKREPDEGEEGDYLKNLINLYDMHGKAMGMPAIGYEEAKITYEAILSRSGVLLKIKALRRSLNKKPYSQLVCVPKGAVKTFNVAANFAWGNADYLFRNDEKRAAFVKMLRDVCGNEIPDEIRPVFQFYDENFDETDVNELLEAAGVNSENLVFRIVDKECFVHDNNEVKKCWERWYFDGAEGEKQRCVITGEIDYVADKHPTVKGVHGSSSLARLISLDRSTTALQSYSYKGNENAPISMMASFKIHAALNYMLQHNDNKYDTPNGTIVFWARNSQILTESIGAILGIEKKEFYPEIPKGEAYYLMELRANGTGRIYIRQYIRLVYGESKEKLEAFLLNAGCRNIQFELLSQWEGKEKTELRKERAFLLGNLFAIMEQAYIDAIPKGNAWNKESDFYIANFKRAMNRPAMTFALLHPRCMIYLKKVDYGLGKEYTDVTKRLERFSVPYPENQNQRERVLFASGYEMEKKRLEKKRNERIEKYKFRRGILR